MGPKGILFLQETHSSLETEKKWIDDFKDKIYYSHDKTNSLLKKYSLSEIITLNKTFNLCDIWRVRNPHKKTIHFPTKTFHRYYTTKT